jgi:hypothetical protein
MKKNITLSLLLLAACTVSLNAQITLYKGIVSGQSESDLKAYLSASPGFTYEVFNGDFEYYTTNILGKLYIVRPDYNKYSELYIVDFVSDSCYSSVYNANLKDNVMELVALMRDRFGEPVYDGWSELTELADNTQKIIYLFGSDPDIGGIRIEKNFDDTYSVVLAFEDMSLEQLDDNTSATTEDSTSSDDSDSDDDWF